VLISYIQVDTLSYQELMFVLRICTISFSSFLNEIQAFSKILMNVHSSELSLFTGSHLVRIKMNIVTQAPASVPGAGELRS